MNEEDLKKELFDLLMKKELYKIKTRAAKTDSDIDKRISEIKKNWRKLKFDKITEEERKK